MDVVAEVLSDAFSGAHTRGGRSRLRSVPRIHALFAGFILLKEI